MRIHCIIQKIFHFLCRPFVQWLVGLIVSTLLAMSLGYTVLVIAFPRSGNEVILVPFSHHASTATLTIGGLTSLLCIGGQIEGQLAWRKKRNQDAGGRQA